MFGQARDVLPEPLSVECCSRIALWVQQCSNSHKACRREIVPSPLPTRVLDVSPDTDGIDSGIRLNRDKWTRYQIHCIEPLLGAAAANSHILYNLREWTKTDTLSSIEQDIPRRC